MQQRPCLVTQFSLRKHLPGGCILGRFCTCKEPSDATRKVCPPHKIWPLIAARTEPGEVIRPQYNRNNFNRCLKFILTKTNFAGDQKFTSEAFRRWGTHEILQTCNNIGAVEKSGVWVGRWFRPYVVLEIDAPRKGQKLHISRSDGSSSEEESTAKKNRAARKNGGPRLKTRSFRHPRLMGHPP